MDYQVYEYVVWKQQIDGSYKIGHYIPGTKIPILNEEILKKSKPDFLMLFSWHIKKELKNNLRKKNEINDFSCRRR